MSEKYTFGIDVGGTKMLYGIFNGTVEPIDRYLSSSDKNMEPETFFDLIIKTMYEMMKKNNLKENDIESVGIAMPSFIRYKEGIIVRTVNLTKIKNFNAKEYFAKHTGIKVYLDNDAHAAALAEHKYGAGAGTEHMLFCPISTGISSGIIINGKLFRGSYGYAGESGHMLITPGEGVECGCGKKGCFMSHISGSMIVKHIKHKIDEGYKTVMVDIAEGKDNITGYHLQRACEMGDTLAIWALEHISKYMAIWLYNLYVTLNINYIVFGGSMTNFGSMLFERVKKMLYEYKDDETEIFFHLAKLGTDSAMIGASQFHNS